MREVLIQHICRYMRKEIGPIDSPIDAGWDIRFLNSKIRVRIRTAMCITPVSTIAAIENGERVQPPIGKPIYL
jgi:hypothetical protein